MTVVEQISAESKLNIPLPDKVTIPLRGIERDNLQDPAIRTVLDLMYGGMFEVENHSKELEVHSLVFLYQHYGIIHPVFKFEPVEGYNSQSYSWKLSDILNRKDLTERKFEGNKLTYYLTPQYRELIKAVNGPQTIKDNRKLDVLRQMYLNFSDRRTQVLKLANLLFLKDCVRDDIKARMYPEERAQDIIDSCVPKAEQDQLKELDSAIKYYSHSEES